MKTYYILYETTNSTHWRIRNTNNDLETSMGLIKEIEDLDKETGKEIIIVNWKELNLKKGIRGFFQRLFWGV